MEEAKILQQRLIGPNTAVSILLKRFCTANYTTGEKANEPIIEC